MSGSRILSAIGTTLGVLGMIGAAKTDNLLMLAAATIATFACLYTLKGA